MGKLRGQPRGRRADDLPGQLVDGIARVGPMARERFEKYHAEGVKIRASVDFRACCMFRRSITKGPQGYRARDAHVARLVPSLLEAGERDFAVFAHHEIFRS